MRVPWTEVDLSLVRQHYADTLTDDLARALGRTASSVYQLARKLGLSKSEAHLASEAAGRIQRGKQHAAMKATQFRPGQPAWNKGLKGVVGVQEACRATQFKPGRAPQEAKNYRPIGSLRVCRDGYVERKVSDDPSIYPARRWVAVHRLVWEAEHGPIPAGHAVVFKCGQHTTDAEAVTLDRIELVSRAELMRRNSYHTNYPPEVARLIQLTGAVQRQINKRAKHEQEPDRFA